jgi:hypothetical protein
VNTLFKRWPDPALHESASLLKGTLRNSDAQIAKYLQLPPNLQALVIARLKQRITETEPGNTAPAVSILVAVSSSLLAVLGAVTVASYSGELDLVNRLIDPTTGLVHGLTEKHWDGDVQVLIHPLVVTVMVLAAIATAAFLNGLHRDYRRSIATAWLHLYEHAPAVLPTQLNGFQSREDDLVIAWLTRPSSLRPVLEQDAEELEE